MEPVDAGATALGQRVWTEITSGDPAPLLVVPVGSCEQHGPHLPLDTDTRIAEALARMLATQRPGILVTPTLGITASGEHRGFSGTLSIGAAALQTVLTELVRSADWSAGVVLVNGHGGNLAAVDAAVRLLTEEGRRVFSWWPNIPGGDGHAGSTETSLMLAIAPSSVRTDAMVAGNTEALLKLMPQLGDGGVAAVSANGVLGDPVGATAEDGNRLLAALASDLIDRVDAWQR